MSLHSPAGMPDDLVLTEREEMEGGVMAYYRIAQSNLRHDRARAVGVVITTLILAVMLASLLVVVVVGSVGEVIPQLG